MRRRWMIAGACALVLLLGVVALQHLWTPPRDVINASSWECTGHVVKRDTLGDVRVPRGRTCRLDGVNETGRVDVRGGGTLVLDRSTILGDIDIHNAGSVELRDSTVTGTLHLNGPKRANVTRTQFDRILINRTSGPVSLTNSVVQTYITLNAAPHTLVCRDIVEGFLHVPNCDR